MINGKTKSSKFKRYTKYKYIICIGGIENKIINIDAGKSLTIINNNI